MTTPFSRDTRRPSPSWRDRPPDDRHDRERRPDDARGPTFGLPPALIAVLLALAFLLAPLLFQLGDRLAP